jgi:peptidoglycan/LPS O-acetylase OafA/YrhL
MVPQPPHQAAPARERRADGHQPQLDGVRGVAVLAIVAFHASTLMPGGYIGVDLFFVLSGFLITRILLREIDTTGAVSVTRFYARRALRLLPALFLMCAIVTPLFIVLPITQKSETLVGTLAALTYTSSILAASGHDLGWMIHTWSLSVEEYFYLLWPMVLVLVATRRHRVLAMVSVTALAVAYQLLARMATDWSVQRTAYSLDTRAEQLLIGACGAMLLTHRPLRIGALATVLAATVFPVFTLLPGSVGSLLYLHGGSTVIALAALVLVLGLVGEQNLKLQRVASIRPLVWTGQRSYGIYLWNLPIVAIIAALPVPGAVQMPVKLLLTFLVPALSYRYVEQPFLRRKARYESGAAVAATPTPHPSERPAAASV